MSYYKQPIRTSIFFVLATLDVQIYYYYCYYHIEALNIFSLSCFFGGYSFASTFSPSRSIYHWLYFNFGGPLIPKGSPQSKGTHLKFKCKTHNEVLAWVQLWVTMVAKEITAHNY